MCTRDTSLLNANPSKKYPMLFKIYTKTNQLAFEAICPNTKTPFLILSSIGTLRDREHSTNHKFHAYKC
jgi:hypothetical protein